MKKIIIKKNKGFTIIETMISISLFLVIVMAGMGALLNANLLHRKSQDMRSVMDNLNFVMDDISRNLRTGYNYHCIDGTNGTFTNINLPMSCANGGGIAFTTSSGKTFSYFMGVDNSVPSLPIRIWKATQAPYDVLPPNPLSPYIQLTPNEVNISSTSSFSILGAEPKTATPPDFQQPFVTIRLAGTIQTTSNISTPFSIQTSVSQRVLDN